MIKHPVLKWYPFGNLQHTNPRYPLLVMTLSLTLASFLLPQCNQRVFITVT